MFVVLNIEAPPEHLRGYLERFLHEVRTGLYVGTLSAKVADRLWEVVVQHVKEGDAVMVRPSDDEAGYRVVATDHPHWSLRDFDGWVLSRRITAP